MAMDQPSLDISCDDDGIIRCVACNALLKPTHIALMSRRKPGGPFDAMCRECAYEVLRAASFTLQLDGAMSKLLS